MPATQTTNDETAKVGEVDKQEGHASRAVESVCTLDGNHPRTRDDNLRNFLRCTVHGAGEEGKHVGH